MAAPSPADTLMMLVGRVPHQSLADGAWYRRAMTRVGQGNTTTVTWWRVLLLVIYLGLAVSMVVGAAQISSMGGELPAYDPTSVEQSHWDRGNALIFAGAIGAIVWGTIVILGRALIRLCISTALMVALGGIALSAALFFFTWLAFVP